MRVGVFMFGGVEMDDAGAGPPAPTDRRYTNEQMWRATEQLLEESIENKTWIVGSSDDVIEGIQTYADALGGVADLVIFPNMLGDPYAKTAEQMTRFAEDVMPHLT